MKADTDRVAEKSLRAREALNFVQLHDNMNESGRREKEEEREENIAGFKVIHS